ncbi:transposable element Tcb1 transposase [Trichonephila clavipes]|nr:transposable element Tcb1 transposase [Trichonephila clavipes]
MYGSDCTDMQVDVMGECLSSIKHVVGARRNRRQTAGEIARHTTHSTGRPISRFTVARRLHSGGLFARRPVRCVPLTPAHRRRRSLWCREHRNWRDNEWGRVLFTDESRFSLNSDSHRILIWRERGSRNHPRTSLKGTGAMGLQFLFMDDNAPCYRTVAAEQLLESEDIERMDWPARSPDLKPIEHVWDFLGRRLAARTLPPVTIRELRLALVQSSPWQTMENSPCPSHFFVILGAEMHEQMFRSGGQSNAKRQVFSFQVSLVLIYSPNEETPSGRVALPHHRSRLYSREWTRSNEPSMPITMGR